MPSPKILIVGAVLSVALAAAPASASADNTFVNAGTGDNSNDCLSAGTACATITAAVDKTGDGDTVKVAPGTYGSVTVSTGNSKSIQATDPDPANTIIDGLFGTGIDVEVPTLTISGFTIRGDNTGARLNAVATLNGNVFDETAASAVHVTVGPSSAGTIISNNTFSDDGTGASYGLIDQSDTTTSNNTFTNFSDPILFSGGTQGVYNNEISQTNANGSKAAIKVYDSAVPPYVTADIAHNYIHSPASTNVLGVDIETGIYDSVATLRDNRIFDMATGVLANSDDVITLIGNEISSSESGSIGLEVARPNVTSTNDTIVDNDYEDVFIDNTTFSMDASIVSKEIWGNGTPSCTVTNSAGPPVPIPTFPGCADFAVTTTSPSFVNRATRDYHLTAPSPLIDVAAGNPGAGNADIDGDTRDKDRACPVGEPTRDIGADEYNADPTAPLAADCNALAAPTVSTNPLSPANNNMPFIYGTGAPAGSLVDIYDTPCTGSVQSILDGSTFTAAGGSLTVADDSATDFYAKTTSHFGVVSPCSTAAHYVEDSTRPNTSITGKPKSKVKTKKTKTKVAFRFSGAGTGGHYKCKMDSGALASCTSGKSYKLKKGSHKFTVVATDAAGNVDPSPAVYKFKIKKK